MNRNLSTEGLPDQHETEAIEHHDVFVQRGIHPKAYGKEKYDEGLSEGMIAQMIGYPSDTVRKWLAQAGGCA